MRECAAMYSTTGQRIPSSITASLSLIEEDWWFSYVCGKVNNYCAIDQSRNTDNNNAHENSSYRMS